MNLDAFWLLFIQDHLRNGLLTPLMVVVTMLGNKGIIWMVLIALLLWRRRTRWVGALAAVSFLVNAGLAELIIKHAVMRPRPFLTIPELQTLVAQPLTYSFPSVHTVSSFSVAFIVWRSSLRKWRRPVMALACLMACSRLYVGVHYPSDVAAGLLLAWVGRSFVWRLGRRAVRLACSSCSK